MFLGYVYSIDIDTILEPPLSFADLEIIATHLPFPHAAVLSKRPIFQAITALPLHLIVRVLILIPELHGDLVVLEGEQLFAELVILLLLPLPR